MTAALSEPIRTMLRGSNADPSEWDHSPPRSVREEARDNQHSQIMPPISPMVHYVSIHDEQSRANGCVGAVRFDAIGHLVTLAGLQQDTAPVLARAMQLAGGAQQHACPVGQKSWRTISHTSGERLDQPSLSDLEL